MCEWDTQLSLYRMTLWTMDFFGAHLISRTIDSLVVVTLCGKNQYTVFVICGHFNVCADNSGGDQFFCPLGTKSFQHTSGSLSFLQYFSYRTLNSRNTWVVYKCINSPVV
jgi:hypothetical protein